ncbi:hypothetical protein BHU61_03975 [Macrococcus epidermidis]|uniref:DUF1659 domain-containing protein n=1 Tax=Macrococcus epidermidis TaxID=1902580 RepID=A0A327ZWN8_9STAP|nr:MULTISPECIES: DUF1659 domain-containing protein [Macrococcus]MCG7420001.1 DUF1659 domain-containing protein [Macrococcus epidermidis]MCH4984650.1 DUF1659 domain-containing protein [Macrococcus sp. PK]RAK46625.1 hypothetical protein BHU61_03975 [Macrococcus epidermidis]UTH15003.1 DUF1659 domain-containing protein [Macrococcus epidermidis]
MLKEVVLNLMYVTGVKEDGKEVFKTRRFNQVRMDLLDSDLQNFATLMSELTGEDYVKIDKVETKAVI